jgi:DNA mismatch endonuclease, patch repair protein
MSRVLARGTKPEQTVRAALRKSGRRFTSQCKSLPGKPDFVVPDLRLAVFVNGCFWHWHGCPRSRMPSSNAEYWNRKIEGNRKRDRRSKRLLTASGWHYVTIWECNLAHGISRLLRRLAS